MSGIAKLEHETGNSGPDRVGKTDQCEKRQYHQNVPDSFMSYSYVPKQYLRILAIAACPLPWHRGTPIRIHHMENAIVDKGHHVEVITYPLFDDNYAANYTTHRVRNIGLHVTPDPGPSLTKSFVLDPQLILKARRLITESQFDVILAHHYEGLISALCARALTQRQIPIVYDAHTLLVSELSDYRLGLPAAAKKWIGKRIDTTIPTRADHIVAVSKRMKNWFCKIAMISESKISVISNGVEYEHFSQPTLASDQPNRDPRITFSGNLAGYQGVNRLLESFKGVLQAKTTAKLSILTASNTQTATKRCKELGIDHAVTFSNPKYEELPKEFSRADVLVNPRVHCDGIPQKLLNYMAAGKPIVSYAGSAEVLEHNHSALLVKDYDIQGFTDSILALLNDPKLRLRIGAAAQDLAKSNYSWPIVADQMISVFLELVNPYNTSATGIPANTIERI
ncbi:MAG: glycosyltransferase family 4 protein [Gammaproteobacteria bacterium]